MSEYVKRASLATHNVRTRIDIAEGLIGGLVRLSVIEDPFELVAYLTPDQADALAHQLRLIANAGRRKGPPMTPIPSTSGPVYHQAVTDPAAAVPIEARLPASRRTQQEPTMATQTVNFNVNALPLIDNLRILAAALAEAAEAITAGLDELEGRRRVHARPPHRVRRPRPLDLKDHKDGPAET